MKTYLLALAAAVAVLATQSLREASAYQCKTVKGRCAVEVGGTCERQGNSEHIRFLDRPGATYVYESCVSRLSKAEGKPDPYVPSKPQAAPGR